MADHYNVTLLYAMGSLTVEPTDLAATLELVRSALTYDVGVEVKPLHSHCRYAGCTATYHPNHRPGETGWRFSPTEPEDVPAHDHYGVAL